MVINPFEPNPSDIVWFYFGNAGPMLPNDLRLEFRGPFSTWHPSLLNGLTFFNGMIEVDSTDPYPYKYWDVNVASAKVSLISATNVPEPGTMLLLGMGLVGLVGYSRKKLAS